MLRIKNPLHARMLQHVRKHFNRRRLIIGVAAILALFVIANGITWLVYRERMYPHSGVNGWQVGNKSYSEVGRIRMLSNTFVFQTNYAQKSIATKDLGAQANWPGTLRYIKSHKPFLPIAGLFGRHDYDLLIDYNQKELDKAVADLVAYFARPSIDWNIDISSGEPKLIKGKDGTAVDRATLKLRFYQGISNGFVTVPTKSVAPKVSNKELQPLVTQLTAKRQVKLSYAYNGSVKKPSSLDILSWYDITSSAISLNKTRVSSYLSGLGTGLGIRVQNLTQLTNDTATALEEQTALTATITAAPKAVKQYTFCVRAKNVSDSELPGFAAKIASTLNDPRGWSLDGQVSFTQVSSGCSMVMWLSAAADMPSFGAICDSTWSCTVRPNVIINYDRWTGASDAWNASGGSLDDYRSMVINHESGHWLGFGHRYCGGAGQQAPVMQQQSISLQGCTFNPWPSDAEKNTLKAQLGL